MKNKNTQLLGILSECVTTCYNCFVKSLKKKNRPIMPVYIKTSVDWGKICQLTAVFISQGPNNTEYFTNICIESFKNYYYGHIFQKHYACNKYVRTYSAFYK